MWSVVAQAVSDAGAERCFGLVGGANFKVTHALTAFGVPFVGARHECGAVAMADAASRLSGRLNAVSVTAGPGLTNALTGIAEAAKSDTPLVVLAGDVAVGDELSSFSMRQRDCVGSVGARWAQVACPDTAYRDALSCASVALEERCPVVLSLPVDVQERWAPRPVSSPTGVGRAGDQRPLRPDADEVRALVDLVEGASRPLILAGKGAATADAEAPLVALARTAGALVATTLQAHGMFAGDPWNLGISGGYASPAATELIPQADLVVAFGASLNEWTTKKGRLLSGAKVVQIDDRRDRFDRVTGVDLSVLGDAAGVASLAAADLRRRGPASRQGWRNAETAALIAGKGHGSSAYADVGTDRFIDPRTFTKAVDRMLPRERVVVLDGGHFTGWPIQHLSVPDAKSWCMPIAFQSIGLGLASAIGAAVASPDSLVVLAVGDGGLLMSLPELETAVRLGCRLCVLVYNDAAYGAEVHHYKAEFPLDIVRFPEVDFGAIARALGGRGLVARRVSDLAPLAEWATSGGRGLFLVDARIDPGLAADWFMQVVGNGKL